METDRKHWIAWDDSKTNLQIVCEMPNGEKERVALSFMGRCAVQLTTGYFSDPFPLYGSWRDMGKIIANNFHYDFMLHWDRPAGRPANNSHYINIWLLKKRERYVGSLLNEVRKEFLAQADPYRLALQRRFFALTFTVPRFMADPQSVVYTDRYLYNDLMAYDAAVYAFAHRRDAPYKTTMPLGEPRNWMRTYGNPPSRTVRRIIMNLPKRMPLSLIRHIRHAPFEHPVTNWYNLVAALTWTSLSMFPLRNPFRDNTWGSVGRACMHNDPETIQETIRRYIADVYLPHPNSKGSPGIRKVAMYTGLMRYIHDAVADGEISPHVKSLLSAYNQARAWHVEAAEIAAQREAERRDVLTSSPPARLVESLAENGITFLPTVGAVVDEGLSMKHCVGTYADKAVTGRSFLFHVEHEGEHATAEIDSDGRLVQIHGPHNAHNKACDYGRIVLDHLSDWQ